MDFVVCGWFTPDYHHWWDRLRRNLDDIGAPHDFVQVSKEGGGWERNTMRKPHEVLAAMDRHSDKTVIFLDVDCIVSSLKGLHELASIQGDVGLHFAAYWRRRRWHGPDTKHWFHTGTMVLKPTAAARRFVKTWILEGENAPPFSVDQNSLIIALGKGGVTVTFLDDRFCTKRSKSSASSIIIHDTASVLNNKATRLGRVMRLLCGG